MMWKAMNSLCCEHVSNFPRPVRKLASGLQRLSMSFLGQWDAAALSRRAAVMRPVPGEPAARLG
jgi:hypothetical protein